MKKTNIYIALAASITMACYGAAPPDEVEVESLDQAVTACSAFPVELATCKQDWGQLPEGRARLDLGTGQLTNVRYKLLGVANRVAHIQGDIILGDESSLRGRNGREGIGQISTGLLWPEGRIPFEIDPSLPNPQRVYDAIAAWERVTWLQFVDQSTERANDFVRFVDGDGCASYVGRVGGAQTVKLNAGCSTGNAIHEIACSGCGTSNPEPIGTSSSRSIGTTSRKAKSTTLIRSSMRWVPCARPAHST